MNSFVPAKENIRVQTITYSDGSVQDSAIDFDSIHVRKKLKVDGDSNIKGDFTVLGDTITNNIVSNEVITNVIKYENDVDEFGNILEQTKAITDDMYDSLTQLISNAGTVPNPLTLGGTTITGGADHLTLTPSTGGNIYLANNAQMVNTSHVKRQFGATYFNFLDSGSSSSFPSAVGRIYQGVVMYIQSFVNGGEIKFHTRNVSGLESFPLTFSYEYVNINVNDQCNIIAGTSFMQVLKNVSVIINAAEKIEFRCGSSTPNTPTMVISPGNVKLLGSLTLADDTILFGSELSYLSGVTSSIQTQLDGKLGSGANTMQSLTINGTTASTNTITQSYITGDVSGNPNLFKYSEFNYDAGSSSIQACLKITSGAPGTGGHSFNFYPKINSGYNPINDSGVFAGVKRSIIGSQGGVNLDDPRCITLTNHANQRSGIIIYNNNASHASTEIWGGNNYVRATAQDGITARVNIDASNLTLQHEYPNSTINSKVVLDNSSVKLESGATSKITCDKTAGVSMANVTTIAFKGGSSLGQRNSPAVYTQVLTSATETNVSTAATPGPGIWIITWNVSFKITVANLIIYQLTTGLSTSGTAFQYTNNKVTQTFGDTKLQDSVITSSGTAIIYLSNTPNIFLRAFAVLGAGPGVLTTDPLQSSFSMVCVSNNN